ncbi:hypothetical protein GCM10009827_042230 [Dactylosporangium maewongense]|uniref:Uncharacterized protein n=1 Tax=Dactylosporangium maewongense TaxID=634393 RepID=A0ABN2ALT5_9ACTN
MLPPGDVDVDGLLLGLLLALGLVLGLRLALGLVLGLLLALGLVLGVPPVHAPRSFHSDGVDAGFQPAPTYAVCVTSAWYSFPP